VAGSATPSSSSSAAQALDHGTDGEVVVRDAAEVDVPAAVPVVSRAAPIERVPTAASARAPPQFLDIIPAPAGATWNSCRATRPVATAGGIAGASERRGSTAAQTTELDDSAAARRRRASAARGAEAEGVEPSGTGKRWGLHAFALAWSPALQQPWREKYTYGDCV
jgi:hypothetical protein